MPQLVMVWKLVMTTSSLGIIMRERKRVKRRFFPRNSSRAKANAAGTITSIISAVVAKVKMMVLVKYRASGTRVKAST